ncbi:MAG: damage-control phosphatase ARMT1 family protein [Candidatus Hinthialibacter sp.]
MKSYLECIPCFLRQTLESISMISEDESIREDVLRSVLRDVSHMDLNDPPPLMGQRIHRLIRKKTGVIDPYSAIKKQYNQAILAHYDQYQTQIQSADDPLETAIRLAIAGNIIDCGAFSGLTEDAVQQSIESALHEPLLWNRDEFCHAIDAAESILYLADNAGEIVFDRLLIEQLPMEKITVAVRGFPILNDVTLEDAREIGLTDVVNVIDNGSDAPGAILSDCSEEFVKRFQKSDLIFAKGQGNYETLSDVDHDIYFLLKAKCPVIARDIGCKVGALILKRSSASAPVAAEM